MRIKMNIIKIIEKFFINLTNTPELFDNILKNINPYDKIEKELDDKKTKPIFQLTVDNKIISIRKNHISYCYIQKNKEHTEEHYFPLLKLRKPVWETSVSQFVTFDDKKYLVISIGYGILNEINIPYKKKSDLKQFLDVLSITKSKNLEMFLKRLNKEQKKLQNGNK
jgi:hypothetical protein